MCVGFPSPRSHGGDALGPGGCCALVPQLRSGEFGSLQLYDRQSASLLFVPEGGIVSSLRVLIGSIALRSGLWKGGQDSAFLADM